jgi:hypothetical protein
MSSLRGLDLAPSDSYAVAYARLVQILLGVYTTLDLGSRYKMSESATHCLVQSFEKQLTDWRSSLSTSIAMYCEFSKVIRGDDVSTHTRID